MKVLVIGGGGREHAIAHKLSQSPRVTKIFCAPGNPGTATFAENVDLKADDITGLAMFAKENEIDMTVPGPEAPLVAGIVDRFEGEGLAVFGPKQAAAELEGSKSVAKRMMRQYKIPTAGFETFRSVESACDYIDNAPYNVVVKAVGLAAGKGVVVADTKEEAKAAVAKMIREESFGEAGKEIVVEERMEGPEVSILLFSDGESIVLMPASQDHKPAFDGGAGPNTGGMGAFTPSPLMTPQLEKEIIESIVIPSVHAAKQEFGGFKGILYIGCMLTEAGPKVLEYNVRFGDPECQPLLAMLKSDLVDIFEAVIKGNLGELDIEWHEDKSAVCVVLASEGYPGDYPKGRPITGLDKVEGDTVVYHAGTKSEQGQVVTSGGRVLGVTSLGETLEEARAKAYAAVEQVKFDGMHFRTDIGSYNIE